MYIVELNQDNVMYIVELNQDNAMYIADQTRTILSI